MQPSPYRLSMTLPAAEAHLGGSLLYWHAETAMSALMPPRQPGLDGRPLCTSSRGYAGQASRVEARESIAPYTHIAPPPHGHVSAVGERAYTVSIKFLKPADEKCSMLPPMFKHNMRDKERRAYTMSSMLRGFPLHMVRRALRVVEARTV